MTRKDERKDERGERATREVPPTDVAPASAPVLPCAGGGALTPCRLTGAGLAAAELWLEERLYAEARPGLRHARVRMWFIFMLLRHAGLRLVEIFRLRGDCLDFASGLLRVPGSAGGSLREVPLAPAVAGKLGGLWTEWEGRELPRPFLCDASRVRRGLSRCALACGLSPALFTARELRRNRGLELAAEGLHPSLVDMFLGREAAEKKSLVRFDADAAQRLLRERIQGHARSSARNHFHGRVTRVRPMGLLADVAFATASGLEVRARITSLSRRSLGLAPGVIVSGAVKALWIEVHPADNWGPADGAMNRLAGTVEAIRREDGFAEILASLDGGLMACAVRPAGEVAWLRGPGEKVAIVFSPEAVILTVG